MTRQRVLDVLGWFVDWEPGIPWDDDAKHCSWWMWRHRLAGWFACPFRGHVWYPDICNIRAHDLCSRCGTQRGMGR